jgi:hypothetical protein
MQPNTPFVGRHQAERYLAANPAAQPHAQDQGPAEAPLLGAKVVRLALTGVAIVLLLLTMAALFFLFGEDRSRQVQRPALTARQRAQAFKL